MTATPGPKDSFLLGNLREFSQDMLGFFTRSARDYGDVVRLRLVNRTAFLVNHPVHIETVLVRQHERFIKHRFFWSRVRALFGQGLVASEGAYWRQQRLLIQPSFNRERLARYGGIMVAETEAALAEWGDGEVRNLHAEFTRLTLRIAIRAFFGAEPSERTLGLARAFTAAAEEIMLRMRSRYAYPIGSRPPETGAISTRSGSSKGPSMPSSPSAAVGLTPPVPRPSLPTYWTLSSRPTTQQAGRSPNGSCAAIPSR